MFYNYYQCLPHATVAFNDFLANVMEVVLLEARKSETKMSFSVKRTIKFVAYDVLNEKLEVCMWEFEWPK